MLLFILEPYISGSLLLIVMSALVMMFTRKRSPSTKRVIRTSFFVAMAIVASLVVTFMHHDDSRVVVCAVTPLTGVELLKRVGPFLGKPGDKRDERTAALVERLDAPFALLAVCFAIGAVAAKEGTWVLAVGWVFTVAFVFISWAVPTDEERQAGSQIADSATAS